MKIIAQNKKAFSDYTISDTMEAGVVLTGDEVKSLRAGNVSLVDAFATFHQGELMLTNCYIGAYSHAYSKQDYSRRPRKLLLKKREIHRLIGDMSRKGLTLLPLKVYLNNRGYVKIEIGLAKHRKVHEKKQALRERDIARETARAVKHRLR